MAGQLRNEVANEGREAGHQRVPAARHGGTLHRRHGPEFSDTASEALVRCHDRWRSFKCQEQGRQRAKVPLVAAGGGSGSCGGELASGRGSETLHADVIWPCRLHRC